MTEQHPTSLWDRALTLVLTAAAVAVAALLIRREFFPPTPQRLATYAEDWRDDLPMTRVFGNPEAQVIIVAFSDLECPFCRNFHHSMRTALARHPDKVGFVFVHFPLPVHTQALEAARAAECAAAVGHFGEALDYIFANQDSLGKRDWTWFAEGAGVTDASTFDECMAVTTTPEQVQLGLTLGAARGIRGTPTVYLNGWRYGGTPMDVDFQRAVDELVAGRKPYDDFPTSAINAQNR